MDRLNELQRRVEHLQRDPRRPLCEMREEGLGDGMALVTIQSHHVSRPVTPRDLLREAMEKAAVVPSVESDQAELQNVSPVGSIEVAEHRAGRHGEGLDTVWG